MRDAGFEVSTALVDFSLRESVQALVKAAINIGSITGVIHAAGVSPTQAMQSRRVGPPLLFPRSRGTAFRR